VWTVHADLSKAERVDEKRFLIANVAHRQYGAEEAARPDVPAHLFRRPGITLIARVLDHLEEQSRRMAHANVLGAKPLLDAAMLGTASVEVRLPERGRPQAGPRRFRPAVLHQLRSEEHTSELQSR